MKPIYKALFCGDRNWSDKRSIAREIRRLLLMCEARGFTLVIIEGEAQGADILSRIIAENKNVHVCRVAALWATRHRFAGPQRNDIMLALEPHEVVAFHPDLAKSKGTKDMVKKARDKGIKTKVVKK